jgi:hypothetical protein
MTATEWILIHQGEEDEACWLSKGSPASADNHGDWLSEVPVGTLARFDDLSRQMTAIINSVVRSSGRDAHGDLPEPCDEYDGWESQARTWWVLEVPQAEDGDSWPARDADLGQHFETEQGATHLLAQIRAKGELWMVTYAGGTQKKLQLINPTTLRVAKRGYRGSWSSCQHCGHDHASHDTSEEE